MHNKILKAILYDIPYMWPLKDMIQMNLFMKQKETHDLEINLSSTKGQDR